MMQQSYQEEGMTAILYCEECKERLEKSGELVAEFVKDMCEDFLLQRKFTYISVNDSVPSLRDQQLVRFLEQRGYLVSKELKRGDVLKIKPLGLRCFNEQDGCLCHICFNPKEHSM
jgi:hypothetical protein